jgi:hypothetical protein
MSNAARRVFGVLVVLVAMAGPAAAAGLPDILGIQLGMPLRDANAKVQAQFPKGQIQVTTTQLQTIAKPVIRSFVCAAGENAEGKESDIVTVNVTLPPNKQVVWNIVRQHHFPGQGTLKTTLVSSLRAKYGKETRGYNTQNRATTDDKELTRMVWLVDEQGRPATPPPLSSGGADPLFGSCPGGINAGTVAEVAPAYNGNAGYKWCLTSWTAVTVVLIEPPHMPELYSQMEMSATSLPLAAQAGAVTAKWMQDISEGQRKQELEKAAQQEKTKL